MAQVNTVRGPIDSAALGRTLVHEHISIRTPGIRENWPELSIRDQARENAIAQLRGAASVGIGAVIDLTTADLGRDIALMREVAEAVPEVQIVCATGIYWIVPRYWWHREVEEITAAIVREITEGIGDTGIRPGAIKLASDMEAGGLTALNEKILRAGARAHRATGVPILTHNGPPTLGAEQVRVFQDEGVSLRDNVVIGHVGDTTDTAFLKGLMRSGACIGMDRFGLDRRLPFADRVATVATLCKEGFAEQIVLSHDACCGIDWMADYAQVTALMPNWHLSHISTDVLPALQRAGVSDAQLDQMMIANPRRLLEPATPY